MDLTPAYTQELQQFSFETLTVNLWVPVTDKMQRRLQETQTKETDFPYWAKLWPSAIAMCHFIAAHPSLIADKKVLELAAGLGLPGILASGIAGEVVVSDYQQDAVDIMQSSVELNGFTNITCCRLDWYALPDDLTADVLLLSDINYDPSAFDTLYQVLCRFIDKGTTIILTTPQRLMAKPFIEKLLPYCVQQEEIICTLHKEQAFISVFVLRSR